MQGELLQTAEISQVRVDQGVGRGGGEKWSDSTLNIETNRICC